MNSEFWAKKPRKGLATPTVAEHCRDVHDAAAAVFDAVCHDLAIALGVESDALAKLRPLLRAAAFLHDFAKINSAFQEMLRAKPGDTRRQPVRHEILAAWLLTDPDYLSRWFAGLRPDHEIWPIIWAVAGHHVKMGDPARGATLFNTGSGIDSVAIPMKFANIQELLVAAAAALEAGDDIKDVKDEQFETADDADDGLEQRIARFAEASCQAWNRLRRNPKVVQRTAMLKALLIAADVAGSALTADGQPPEQWIRHALLARISAEALQPIIQKGTKGKSPHEFQQNVGRSEDSATVVIAGCGNGKTTAAYLWAQRHASGRKVWFTYPTTGTASAGYHGYVYDHPDLLATLMHGRDEVDLKAMRGTTEDDQGEESLRLESLRAWGKQAIVCTVDTVLGLLQNQRRPLFSFPAISAGAVVFDEIHSYDTRLFGSLLRFLRTFPGVPVLLMSASIPPKRLEALRDVLGARVGKEILGDAVMQGHKRYRLEPRETVEACRSEVQEALAVGKKVLWVCNTVADAVKEARDAEQWSGLAPEKIIVFHSRFRYRARVKRQQEDVIPEFEYFTEGEKKGQRVKPGAALVIATQVCEMSLDISADMLVTAVCPLPSLVQRLGRLNRYAVGDDPWPCLIYAFEGDPYNEKPEWIQTRGDFRVAMAAARKTAEDFAGKPCTQEDLKNRLDGMVDPERFETYSAWIDDGWLSEPGQLRDGDRSVTLIREEDLKSIEQELGPEHARPSKWTARSLVPWTIPMLYRQFEMKGRAGGYPVAAAGAIAYCEKEGASWQTKIK